MHYSLRAMGAVIKDLGTFIIFFPGKIPNGRKSSKGPRGNPSKASFIYVVGSDWWGKNKSKVFMKVKKELGLG